MEEVYEVLLGNRTVGKVQLQRNGLYCRVICRCAVEGREIRRLYGVWPDRRECFGVLVPEGDGFVLDKRIPVKRLGEGTGTFTLSSAPAKPAGTFVPICPEEPFRYIDQLQHSFLESEHGKIGIRLKKSPEECL